jgi:hypothetical protein
MKWEMASKDSDWSASFPLPSGMAFERRKFSALFYSDEDFNFELRRVREAKNAEEDATFCLI